jgi:hypothetical protein
LFPFSLALAPALFLPTKPARPPLKHCRTRPRLRTTPTRVQSLLDAQAVNETLGFYIRFIRE